MGEAAVEVQDLAREVGPRRDRRVLDMVRFEVQRGEVAALLGPTGSGKTTLLRILAGVLWPDAGRVRVLGLDPVREGAALRARVGVLEAAEPGFFVRLRVLDNLRHAALLHGLRGVVARDRIDQALSLAGCGAPLQARVASLEPADLRRLGLARALLHEPELLLLDEPTAGLEPRAAKQLHGTLRELARNGRTIVLGTSEAGEADAVAHRVAVLAGGRVVADDTPVGLRRLARDRQVVEVRGTGFTEAHITQLRALEDVESVALEDNTLQVLRVQCRDPRTAAPRVLRVLEGARVLDLSVREATLEDAYLGLVGA